PRESFAEYGRVFRDRSYRVVVPVASLGYCAISWLTGSYLLFLRDGLGYSERGIMHLLGAGGIGIVLTIGPWGRFADRHGSARAMTLTLGGFSLAALGWLLLSPGAAWTPFLVWPLTLATLVFLAAFQAAAGQGALSHIPEDSRAVYSNLWLVGTSLAQGGTYILAGLVIDHWSAWGYRACFLLAGCAGLGCAFACRSVLQGGQPLAALFRPLQPLRALRLIVSITIGMEPTIRDLSQK
ncbi:MAG: MFS transporter, partial [Candidatus Sumerlaeota bacterium]|nr:MFS transporter [Candidatus Sumerlaeota bacterium]